MANGYKICIPARLESSRLEQKLLCKVNGKTIIQRTWERCLESSADTVTVITDSTEIFDLISDLGGDCFLCLLYTSPSPRDMRRSRMPSSA